MNNDFNTYCISQSYGDQLARTKQAARFNITPAQRTKIALFWNDEGVQTCFTEQLEFQSGFETMK